MQNITTILKYSLAVSSKQNKYAVIIGSRYIYPTHFRTNVHDARQSPE
jgi:hypothetical protein